MKVLKYFTILILPLTLYFSLTNKGWPTFSTVIFVFGFVPFLEFFVKPNKKNFTRHPTKTKI